MNLGRVVTLENTRRWKLVGQAVNVLSRLLANG